MPPVKFVKGIARHPSKERAASGGRSEAERTRVSGPGVTSAREPQHNFL